MYGSNAVVRRRDRRRVLAGFRRGRPIATLTSTPAANDGAPTAPTATPPPIPTATLVRRDVGVAGPGGGVDVGAGVTIGTGRSGSPSSDSASAIATALPSAAQDGPVSVSVRSPALAPRRRSVAR